MDPTRQDEAALAADPFAALPFELALPERWRLGMPAAASWGARQIEEIAAFVAHDPVSAGPGYGTVLVIEISDPVEDVEAYLTKKERSFHSGMAADPRMALFELGRVVLPAGTALRWATETSLDHFLITPLALVQIKITDTEIRARIAEFDAMAQSFRLRV